MVSSVSNTDPRQNAQQAQEIQRQKQEDEDRRLRNNQPTSASNVQPKTDPGQGNQNRANQNSQQVKGASLDIRA